MTSKNELVVILCPSLSQFKEAPKDHSHSELFDCPKCKNKMWLSRKKKGALLFASVSSRDILLGCYDCIKKHVEDDPGLFMQSIKVGL